MLTYEELYATAVQKPEETKEVMATDVGFNENGLKELCVLAPNECAVFFSQLIGRDVNFETDLQEILRVGTASPENMAKTIVFIQSTKAGMKPVSESAGGRKPRKPRAPREAVPVNPLAPFREGTAKAIIYEVLKSGPVSKTVVEVLKDQFKAHEGLKEPKNIPALIQVVIREAKVKGWAKIGVKDGSYYFTPLGNQ